MSRRVIHISLQLATQDNVIDCLITHCVARETTTLTRFVDIPPYS